LKWAVDPVADVVTTAGDLIYGTAADTVARLGIGTAGQVLKVNSGATAPEWGAAAAGGGLTLLSTTTLTGASVTLSSISQDYTNLQVVVKNAYATGSDWLFLRFNSDTGSNYYRRQLRIASSSVTGVTSAATFIALAVLPTSSNDEKNACAVANLYDYTTTTGQQIVFTQGFGADGVTNDAIWQNAVFDKAAAITSITVGSFSGDFSGGTVLLYGVK
jgi:hypothetical protein